MERLALRQANIAARVIQRKAKPWVANRRAKKEAWALEIISRAFRKYVQRRMHQKKTKVITLPCMTQLFSSTSSSAGPHAGFLCRIIMSMLQSLS